MKDFMQNLASDLKRSICFVLFASSLIYVPNVTADMRIKIGTLAPSGSTWFNSFKKMGKEIEKNSQDVSRFKVYGGGIQGTELDVLKKMGNSQLHGGVFTGPTLGMIVPDFRIMELPAMFRDYKEIDYVWNEIKADITNQFFQKRYIFLGYLELGFVNIFSNHEIKSIDDFKKLKMWVFQGDPISKAMAETFQISPIPLQINDVRTSLQTGLIDSCYAPPLASIAMQWFSKVQYMLKPPVTYSAGALIFSKRKWDKFSPKLQKLIRGAAKRMETQTLKKIRHDNHEALETLEQEGAVATSKLSPENIKKLRTLSVEAWNSMAGKVYSKNILSKVKELLVEYRSGN